MRKTLVGTPDPDTRRARLAWVAGTLKMPVIRLAQAVKAVKRV